MLSELNKREKRTADEDDDAKELELVQRGRRADRADEIGRMAIARCAANKPPAISTGWLR